MKRTCNRCKASREVGFYGYECEFGYKTDMFLTPLEECPKPTTYEEYLECIKIRDKELAENWIKFKNQIKKEGK